MEDKKFLIDILNAASPVMYEWKAQQVWLNKIKPFVDEIHQDNYGNVYGVIKSKIESKNNEKPFKVLIDAHINEISYIVNHISDDGLIHPIKNGGSDIQLALSKDVTILTDKGEIDGFFGWIPIHNKSGKSADVKPERENLFIDIGVSTKEEVLNMGIKIGDPIIYNTKARFLNNTTRLVGKSLDDKIGSYINAMIIQNIFENKIELPFDLYISSSVQEEVGLFGIQILVDEIKPDVAIIFDVHFDASNPLVGDKRMLGTDAKLGDGVVIMNGSCVQKNLMKLIVNIAEESNIKYKMAHSTGMGGTNADKTFLRGVATALLSIPLKYMHTTVETVEMTDVEETIKLMTYVLKNIQYQHNFKYLDF